MARYYLYRTQGCIGDVAEDLTLIEKRKKYPRHGELYDSIDDVFNRIDSQPFFICKKEDLSIAYYAYDYRICRPVFLLSTNKIGKKKYRDPQALMFVVEVKDDYGR